MVATDLDGTIVRDDGSVSDRTRAAFDLVKAAGVPIVGVTGRGPRILDLCRRDLPEADYFVLGQGALAVDLTTPGPPRELSAATMEGALVSEILLRLEGVVGPLSVLVEPVDSIDAFLLGDPNPAWRFADLVRPTAREDALAGTVIKAFAHSERYDADELLTIARTLIGPEIAELTQAGLGYVEICPRGVTKASGLAVVATHIGVDPSDILVFGDMPNDLPMFAYAGWRRLAVASAHADLRAVADEVIGECADDGVAVYLENLFG